MFLPVHLHLRASGWLENRALSARKMTSKTDPKMGTKDASKMNYDTFLEMIRDLGV